MRERPIPFTNRNVGLILQDKKSQTRRAMKGIVIERGRPRWQPDRHTDIDLLTSADLALPYCPYGVPGDTLWVRESWRIGAWNENTGELWLDYRADGLSRRDPVTIPDDEDGEKFVTLWLGSCDELAAKGIKPDSEGEYHWPKGESPLRWRSSRFMPRWASRLLLQVVQVRVQHLQDITEDDAIAEGIYQVGPSAWSWPGDPDHAVFSSPVLAYRGEWDNLNAKRAPWVSKPWVWAVTFRLKGGMGGAKSWQRHDSTAEATGD